VTTRTGPAGQAAGGTGGATRSPGAVGELTVLYDAGCRVCRAAQRWLASRDALVPLRFLPAGSAQARQRFPDLDHRATLRNLTVVADTGAVWEGDNAWLTCLWALTAYRGLSHRLAAPRLRSLAATAVSAAARIRTRHYGDNDDQAHCASCQG
jgi:predicted DCC family thiol-disulfide oxidoreductase YuxK